MAFTVQFDLDDNDLKYFREVMHKAQANAKTLSESTILANAKNLISDIKGTVPDYVRTRLYKVESLVAMVEDTDWEIPAQDRTDILAALAYFSSAEDLVPDRIPVLGFLDDAIMIELVAESLNENIEAFQDFCTFRESELSRSNNKEVNKQDWLAKKRNELNERIRRRRARRQSRGTSFRIF